MIGYRKLGKPFFPNLAECDAYAFLREERDGNAPVSRLQGLSFARHVLGLECLEDATCSKRFVGVAQSVKMQSTRAAVFFT